jgi:hypothetical protein
MCEEDTKDSSGEPRADKLYCNPFSYPYIDIQWHKEALLAPDAGWSTMFLKSLADN